MVFDFTRLALGAGGFLRIFGLLFFFLVLVLAVVDGVVDYVYYMWRLWWVVSCKTWS